jgi:outer membrane lipoprotein SlyB
MKTDINKSSSFILWIVGIAVILFSVAGIASFMGWIPTSKDTSGNNTRITTSSESTSSHVKTKCANCGQIESVQEIVTQGAGTGLGAVGGAVVGGAIGNQVGAGRGKDLATVAGAVGGALAGNEIEKRAKSIRSYAITVRLNDGSSRVIYETNPPTWKVGDEVRITNDMIQLNR